MAVLAAALTTAGPVGPAGAAPAADDPLAESLPPVTGPVAPAGPVGDPEGGVSAPLAGAVGTVTAFVELAAPAAVDSYAEARQGGRSATDAARAATQARQRSAGLADRVLDALRGRDSAAKVVSRTANAIAGLTVTADAARIRELSRLPEVRSIALSVPKSPQNAGSAELTRALTVWQQTGHYGDGVRVGIIDTGIDYTHADFGGPGTVAAYRAVDSTRIDPAYFPTDKVVGGYDFAGNDYDARKTETSTPHPDPNPLDCASGADPGHGTHVAGTAAGYGVTEAGGTFAGDYSTLTPQSLEAMRIAPGSAPKAKLYALKVFGCEGTTNLDTEAMDWALDPNGDGDFSDHLDVVNLSLGSSYGAPDDPSSRFVRKLVANGVLVVTSAGNGGDLYDVGGSPGDVVESLDVANSRDSYAVLDGVEVGGGSREPGQYSQAYQGYEGLDLTRGVVAAGSGNPDGCAPFSAEDRAAVAGKFVWLEWDDNDKTRKCGSAVRSTNAHDAGAAGALLSSSLDTFAAGIAGSKDIPVFQFTGTATTQVRAALKAGTLTVRMTGALRTALPTRNAAIQDTISPSSSRGYRGTAPKPDLAAPGTTILSAGVGSGSRGTTKTGTSMAAPHVSGIAALVRQVHPDWTPEEVKAALMDTAAGDVRSGDDAATGVVETPMRVGSGRIDARAAVQTPVLAMVQDTPGAVGVSFGVVEAARRVSLSRTVKIENKGPSPVRLAASFAPASSVPGVAFELSDRVVAVPAGGVARIQVKVRVDPADLRRTADPTVEKTQQGQARQFLAEASGRLVLAPDGGGVSLRVPVYAAPKPVAEVTASDHVSFQPGADRAVLRLRGKGLSQGSGDQAYRALVSVFELQAVSDRLPDCGAGAVADCAVNETAKGGDLRYVGVTSTAPEARAQGRAGDALLAFGIATWHNWANLGSNTWPVVTISAHGNDFTVRVRKPKDANGNTSADLLLVETTSADGVVVDQRPVNGRYGDVDTNVFDSNVVVLPVLLSALGIDPSDSSARLSYRVGIQGYYTAPGNADGFIDRIGSPMSFDPLRPGLWVRGDGDPALSYLARPGSSLVVGRDAGALAEDRADSLLVLEHHDASDRRAQVVSVR
ncbi:S8 family serine peptidase [Solihabitans fulvus]|uniref:S8 family serine peptidase n=1 Tax=Solihabitans fulvus TaxID=1892852 RepID=UPI0023E8F49E|nr:S8 family serine peptidase [Solihabitans fulvus]